MPWPAGLLTLFKNDRAKHFPFENRYYGHYNTLLNYCFGPEFTFYKYCFSESSTKLKH